jgi:hypothetical protein
MDDEHAVDPTDGPPAIGPIPVSHLVASHPRLVRDLQSINRFDATSVLAGLLTVPELQTCCLRLESLVHLVVGYAAGDRSLAADAVRAVLAELGEGPCRGMEDPPEDVFSTLVMSSKGNHRIVAGMWESAAFFLQRTVNIVERLPTERGWDRLSESVFALLALSDAVCDRSGFGRATFGTDGSVEPLPTDNLDDMRDRVVFTCEDLDALGVRMEAIEPFVFEPGLSDLIPSVSLQHSPLLDHPLLRFGDRIVLALPTAVSVAIRRFVFGGLIDAGLRQQGVALLEDEYGRLLRHRPLFGVGRRDTRILFRGRGERRAAEYGAEIEPGRFLHFILVLDSLHGFDKDGFVGHAVPEPSRASISDRIAAFRRHAERSGSVKEGVTFVISCGIGRTSIRLAPRLSAEAAGDWGTVFLSAPDAETLTLLEVTPQTVLRVCRAKRALACQGVRIFNINGFPNLLAWIRSLEGHIVDHGSIPDGVHVRHLNLMLPTNMVLDLRKQRATRIDRHMALLPDGRMVQVCHLNDSVFEDDERRSLYVDECWDDDYGLRLVYRGKRLDCWCEVRPRQDYERWKMLCLWLPRIGKALSGRVGSDSRACILFQVHFESPLASGKQDFEIPDRDTIAASVSVEVDREGHRVLVRVGKAFEHGLAHPENLSESMLVRRMVEGALRLLNRRTDTETVEALHGVIVPNSDVRHTHFFQVRRFRDFVHDSIRRAPVVPDSIDEATDRLGLGWRFRSREDGPHVEGKKNCAAFLNKVVHGIEDDLCSEIKSFDRYQLIHRALANHEAAMVTQQRWRTTARANLGMRSDKAAVLRTILSKESENNAVLLASRVLVEFAVCECPSAGGAVPGDSDLARLMSKLLLTIHYGGWSDAIYFDAMEPSLRITPLGDIHGDVAFLKDVVEPFAALSGEVIVGGEIDRYAKNFCMPEPTPTIKGAFDPRFLAAWEAEKGLPVDSFRLFADLLEDMGIAEQRAVFRTKWSMLAHRLRRELPEWEEIAESLVLRSRPSWRTVPAGFSAKDLWPWRFRRQLSLLRRPLVQLDAGPDPELIVAPGLVRDALAYTFAGYYEGSFLHAQLTSDAMRSWFGTVATERGNAFTKTVADKARRPGWESQPEVPVRRILAGRGNDRFGDIDVLCWNAMRRRALLLECKDLHFHKSLGEMAEQIQDFRGRVTGTKRDQMRKHIDRTEAIRGNLRALQNYLGCQDELEVESWVVFRHPVPVLLSWIQGDLGVRVTTFDRLSEVLSG